MPLEPRQQKQFPKSNSFLESLNDEKKTKGCQKSDSENLKKFRYTILIF